MEATTQDAQGSYTSKGMLNDGSNTSAIDGTVFQKDDGTLYMVWAARDDGNEAGQNTAVPADFSFTGEHMIKVVKSGTSFSFYLDGALKQTRTFSISNGQIGLVTEDTKADYTNIKVY